MEGKYHRVGAIHRSVFRVPYYQVLQQGIANVNLDYPAFCPGYMSYLPSSK